MLSGFSRNSPRAEPAKWAGFAALLNRLTLVAVAAEAVVARGIKTQRAASPTFLNGAGAVAEVSSDRPINLNFVR